MWRVILVEEEGRLVSSDFMLYFKQIILRLILIALFNSAMLTVIVDKLKNIKGGFEWWFTVECLQMGLEPVYSRSKINLLIFSTQANP